MEHYTTPPPAAEHRKSVEMAVYSLLHTLSISYERVDHAPLKTMDECAGMDLELHIHMCKNLFLRNSAADAFYLLMMPGEKKFRTKEVSRQIGSTRLSFADPEHMNRYLGIKPGAVSIMGLMNDTEKHVQLLVDEDVLKEEYIGCHPCVNTSSLRLKTSDVFEKFLPATGHDFQTVHLD